METKRSDCKHKGILMKISAFIVCAACFALLACDVTIGKYVMKPFDYAMFKGIRYFECGFLTGFFKLMTNMVHPIVILLLSFVMFHFFEQKKYLVPLAGNLVLTLLLNLTVKGALMRVRPPMEWRLTYQTGYSFPSGHSMMAASFYGFLIFMICQTSLTEKKKRRGIILCILMILLVGSSRVYLGVHYATDVIGGFLVSGMYLIFYTSITNKYLEKDILKMDGTLFTEHRILMSFKHSADGLIEGLQREKNMLLYYSALILVVVFGITLQISVIEWSICLILCGWVICTEQINTALEAAVDLVTDERKPLAKLAKDTCAGAVLASVITSVIVGILIFGPKILALLNFTI